VKAGRRLLALFAVLAAGAVGAPLAHAGSYEVLSCTIDGSYHANNAWGTTNNPADNAAYSTDTSCPRSGDPIGVSLAANMAYGNGTYAGLRINAPAQTAITDYKVVMRQYWFAPPLTNYPTERTYTIARFGDYVYSGTGLWPQAEQDALNDEHHWYGYRGAHQSSAADTGLITMTRADSKRATQAPNAGYMAMYAGCFTDDGSACSLGTDSAGNVGTAFLQLIGARVTITDNTAPALSALTAAQGLLAPGTRSGDEPVTFTASDNVGIRRAEIVDVTDAANPSVVGAKDYLSTASAANTQCDFSKPKPCPDLKNETLAPSPAIAGKRTLLMRVTDAAGNQTVSTPFAVTARGPVNGAGGGDGSRLVAGFPGHTFRGHGKARKTVGVLRPTKTVGWGHSAPVKGILRNAAGQPVAGAELRLLVRELRLGSGYVDRGAVTTRADGRFTFRIPRGSSRRYRVAYRAYPGDAGLTAKSDVSFNTKARITIHVPRHVRARGSVRFRGTLPGRPLPPRGVTLELQAHQPGHGWRTVKTTRTRRGGAYSTRYRFNSAGGRFTFRMRLRPNDSYPYARGTSRARRVSVG
jgi:hypothetical protein